VGRRGGVRPAGPAVSYTAVLNCQHHISWVRAVDGGLHQCMLCTRVVTKKDVSPTLEELPEEFRRRWDAHEATRPAAAPAAVEAPAAPRPKPEAPPAQVPAPQPAAVAATPPAPPSPRSPAEPPSLPRSPPPRLGGTPGLPPADPAASGR
jgi:hypothetical protein